MHNRRFHVTVSTLGLLATVTLINYEIQYIQATSASLLITLLGDTLACTGSSDLVSSDREDLENVEMDPEDSH